MDNKKDKKVKLSADARADDNGPRKKPRLSNKKNELLLDKFITIIDKLDDRVEKFRRDAQSLMAEQEEICVSLNMAKEHDMIRYLLDSERTELFNYINRVSERMDSVEVYVTTTRNRDQVQALGEVNSLIEKLIALHDSAEKLKLCQMYWNACSSDADDLSIQPLSKLADKKFENNLLGCTLDDQKIIKKRIKSIMLCMSQKLNIDGMEK